MLRMLVVCLFVGCTVSAQDAGAGSGAGSAAEAERLKLKRLSIETKLKLADLLREQGKLEEAMKLYKEASALLDSINKKEAKPTVRPGGAKVKRDAPERVVEKPVAEKPNRHEDVRVSRVDTEKAVQRALQWLANHQSRDGRWDADDWMRHANANNQKAGGAGSALYDVGVTSLALITFFNAGHGIKNNPFADNVKRGLRWLMAQQDAGGLYGARVSQHFIYNTILATKAMCDGYRVTQDPQYQRAAQRGLDWLSKARNPYMGWRYGVRQGENDTSVTSLAVQALTAGKRAGLQVDPDNFTGALVWVEKMTDPDFGQTGYNFPGGSVARPEGVQDKFPAERSQAMTAAGILVRIHAGQNPRNTAVIRKGLDLIAKLQPAWDERGFIDMYYWYLGTKAMYQAGGPHWNQWRPGILAASRTTLTGQSKDGSWDPVGPWGHDGGRIYSTAIMAMTLQETLRPETDRVFAAQR